ncbi:AraC family transcriptional regulator [Curtobacterium sp. MCPF17_052]|nr:AraC family transcriptional regulator [Curtobacterium sp. MCPF17_052]WIB13918.1 AraC family transcriptional regulator [Curtobacterium sp. MCPF17_052]
MNGRSWLTLDGGDGPEDPVVVEPPTAGSRISDADAAASDVDIVIGGRIDLNATGRELLLRVLPPLMHVGADSTVGAQARGHVQRLFSEITGGRMGSDFAMRQYAQLLVLDVVRGFADDAELPAGWLKVLADEQLRPALDLIHDGPARRWSLEDLARASSMSRSTFAARFREAAGAPPVGLPDRLADAAGAACTALERHPRRGVGVHARVRLGECVQCGVQAARRGVAGGVPRAGRSRFVIAPHHDEERAVARSAQVQWASGETDRHLSCAERRRKRCCEPHPPLGGDRPNHTLEMAVSPSLPFSSR